MERVGDRAVKQGRYYRYARRVLISALAGAQLLLLLGCSDLSDRLNLFDNSGPSAAVERSDSPKAFRQFSFEELSPGAAVPLTSVQDNSLEADVRGNLNQEIIVVRPHKIELYTIDGKPLSSFNIEGGPYGPACTYDFDDDGKEEIVLGSYRSGTGRITVINGTGRKIHSMTLHEMVKGWVKPYPGKEGNIYYVCGSDYNIAPKVVGAYKLGSDTPLWEMHLGPSVNHLDFNTEKNRMALSLVPLSQERREVKVPYSIPREQPRILSLYTDGKIHIDFPIGPRLTAPSHSSTPSPFSDSYAQVDPQFVSFEETSTQGNSEDTGSENTGADEAGPGETDKLLVLLQKYSGFYRGRPHVQLREIQNNMISEPVFDIEGPKNSYVSAIVKGSSIIVVWDRAGLIQKITPDGKITANLSLPGETHAARIGSGFSSCFSSGTFDLQELPCIVTDGNTLYLLNNNLEIIWSRAFPGIISRASWTLRKNAGKTIPALIVQSDQLYIFKPGDDGPRSGLHVYTDPAGMPVSLTIKDTKGGKNSPENHAPPNGSQNNSIASETGLFMDLPSGNATVTVGDPKDPKSSHTITLKPGQHYEIDLRGVHRQAKDVSLHRSPNIGVAHGVHRTQAYINTNTITPPSYLDTRQSGTKPNGQSSAHRSPQLAFQRAVDRSYRIIAGDYLAGPDDTDEVLYFSAVSGETQLLDHTLQTTKRFAFKDQLTRYHTTAIDYDRDGKLDIIEQTDDPFGIRIIAADGKLLFNTRLFPTYDGYYGAFAWTQDQILLALGSGYMEFPRGVASINRWNGEPDFYYPTAVKPLYFYYSPVFNNSVFFNSASVSNGVEIQHDNGYIETDLSLYQHIINLQGQKAPGSRPIEGKENTGALLHFAYTPAPGEEPRVAQIENKHEGYYEGYPKLKLWDPDTKRFVTTYVGPYNKRATTPFIYAHHGTDGQESHCLLCWRTTPFVDIVDSNLQFLRRVPLPEGTTGIDVRAIADIFHTGEPTLFVRSNQGIIALSETGKKLYSIEVPQNENSDSRVSFLVPHNIDNQGPQELLVATRSRLLLYTYEALQDELPE